MNKIRVGIVNYLNTKPLIYGLLREPIASRIELIGAYPSLLAQMLMEDKIDIGLIPVAAIPELPSYHIIGDYCIGADAEIASVALFSEVPMEQITKVYLDYQSRTSVALLRYLMKEFWGINPDLIPAEGEDYRSRITGTSAGLVIGDRALVQRKTSTYIYDLGSEWKSLTGLPFVFATWVSKREYPDEFVRLFNEANEEGLHHIDEIVEEQHFELYDLRKYYNLHLSYHLDEPKRKALEFFLQAIKTGL